MKPSFRYMLPDNSAACLLVLSVMLAPTTVWGVG